MDASPESYAGGGSRARRERVRRDKNMLVLMERADAAGEEDTGSGTPCVGVGGWHLPAQGAIGAHLWPRGNRQVQRQGGDGCTSAPFLPSEPSEQRRCSPSSSRAPTRLVGG